MTDEIRYWREGGVGVIQINRPAARNALNWTAQEQFAGVVAQAAHEPTLRALIITGAGDKAFAAGGDLKELEGQPEVATGERLNRVMSAALDQLTELPVPVLAAVNGDALGGGCEILTACDLRLAAAHARLGFVQVKVALTTGWGGTGRLVRLIGQSRATDLLLTGRIISAAEAQQIGLVHRIVSEGEDVLAAARAWAAELAVLPRQALASTKTLVHAAGRLSLPETYQLERRLFVELWPLPDHLEAMAAFAEKRTAVYGD
jgi:enoyl-CoA hydratase/carnithine racemase